MEFSVGVMLVLLGLLNLSGITQHLSKKFLPKVHSHEHPCPEGGTHTHTHAHFPNFLSKGVHHLGLFQTFRPLVVGFVHGLAGSAAIALLILSTIDNPFQATLYLFVFHFGVIAGMMLITTLLGISITFAKQKSESVHKYLVVTSGVLSLLFGVYVMYETGYEGGLFSSQVTWNPH